MALYSDTRFHFNSRFVGFCLLALFIMLGSPLLGVYLAGMNVDRFLEFPPLTRYVVHAPSNPWLFTAGLLSGAVFLALIFERLSRYLDRPLLANPSGYFPWWGLVGLFVLFVSWAASWGIIRLPLAIRIWIFTPLWLGFIIFLNALALWLRGTCLMLRRPLAFSGLFFLSSVFWWYFEFLNRFVQNWYYIGVSTIGPGKYAAMASLAFSTVLPAVMSVNELLKAVTAFEKAFNVKGKRLHLLQTKAFAIFMVLSSATGLAFIGMYPDYLFPLLWISPLLVICGLRVIFGYQGLFHFAASGRFAPLARLSASGLLCGFFWEMWNYYSYPKWVYSIPFVAQCKVFEMPLLGYLGYIPFGLECAAVAAFLIPLYEICLVGAEPPIEMLKKDAT